MLKVMEPQLCCRPLAASQHGHDAPPGSGLGLDGLAGAVGGALAVDAGDCRLGGVGVGLALVGVAD